MKRKKKICSYLYAKRSSLRAAENDGKLKQRPPARGGTDHSRLPRHGPCRNPAETLPACEEALTGCEETLPACEERAQA